MRGRATEHIDLGVFPEQHNSRHKHSPSLPMSKGRAQQQDCDGSHPDDLSDDFFLKIADWCVNDPRIAAKIDDDRTSPLIWGEARSLRFLFLQMCIRDRWSKCREIWPKLSEFERRDYLAVYLYGPPSTDFFLDIMENDEHAWKEVSHLSDCGASDVSTSPGSDSSNHSNHVEAVD